MGKYFLWDPVEDNIVKEIDDSGTTIADYTTEPYLYGDLISQHRAGQSSFYHYDGQGSTTSLTDSGGNATDTYAYSAFGEVTEQTGHILNPFQYLGRAGYYKDNNSDDSLIRARTLSPPRGRWLSLDPLLSMITYLYSSNKPLTLTDPSGWIEVRVDQHTEKKVIKPCGGFESLLWYTVPRKKAPTDKSLYIIQHICIYQGSTSDCMFGAPPEYSCGCAAFQTRKCKPCCYLEDLGETEYDAKKSVFPSVYDGNSQPKYSTHIDCASKGTLAIQATVRAFSTKGNLAMLTDIISWGSAMETCTSGCAPPTPVQLGPHIVLNGKMPPKWFSTLGVIRDEVNVETKATWDCCNAMPNNQQVTLPTGEVWEWKA